MIFLNLENIENWEIFKAVETGYHKMNSNKCNF